MRLTTWDGETRGVYSSGSHTNFADNVLAVLFRLNPSARLKLAIHFGHARRLGLTEIKQPETFLLIVRCNPILFALSRSNLPAADVCCD